MGWDGEERLVRGSLSERLARAIRNEGAKRFEQLGLRDDAEPITDRGRKDVDIALAPGMHGFTGLDGTTTLMSAIAPGVITETKVDISGCVFIHGVRFSRSVKNTAELVHIRATGIVLLSQCIFTKKPQDTSTFILVDTGGRLIVKGCKFADTMTAAGSPIVNGGAINDVIVDLSFNLTGNAFAGVRQGFNIT